MATRTHTLTPEQAATEAEIVRLGFSYTIRPEFELDRLDPNRRIQSREPKNFAPDDAVNRFAVQMHETVFPPIIVTDDDWIVDGNTRVGARRARKEKFSAALVLDVGYESGSQKTKDLLYALALTLNGMNGTPLTRSEIQTGAEYFVRLGWKNEQIARAIGLPSHGVTRVRKEIDARAKLDRVGLSGDKLRGASLRALGAKEVLALNDVPFRDLAALARDAGLNATEITDLAKTAKATGADNEALTVIQELRTESASRIRDHELTGNGKPPVSRMLRMRLGFISKYRGEEGQLVETDPKVAAKHLQVLVEAIEVLTAARDAQLESPAYIQAQAG